MSPYDKLKAEYKCVVCMGEAEVGRTRCRRCADQRNKRHRELRAERKRTGWCTECGEYKPLLMRQKCKRCTERHADYCKRNKKQRLT